MPLDRRLREDFDLAARSVPGGGDDAALLRVADRAAALRHQRRQRASLATATVLVLVVVLAVAHAWLPAPPTPSLGPQPGLPFTSRVHGYDVTYPPGWRVLPATTAWSAGKDEGAPGVADQFSSPDGGQINVWSQALPAGTSDARWITGYLPASGEVAMPACFPAPGAWEPVLVDGHRGGIFGGDYGCSFTAVVVIVDKRAYLIKAFPVAGHVTTAIFDRHVLDGFLGSLRLHPEQAAR